MHIKVKFYLPNENVVSGGGKMAPWSRKRNRRSGVPLSRFKNEYNVCKWM